MAVIYCSACGRSLGSFALPTPAELTKIAESLPRTMEGNMFRMMAGRLPENGAELLAPLLVFRCVVCTCSTGQVNDGGQKDIFKDGGTEGAEDAPRETSAQALYREHAALSDGSTGGAK